MKNKKELKTMSTAIKIECKVSDRYCHRFGYAMDLNRVQFIPKKNHSLIFDLPYSAFAERFQKNIYIYILIITSFGLYKCNKKLFHSSNHSYSNRSRKHFVLLNTMINRLKELLDK